MTTVKPSVSQVTGEQNSDLFSSCPNLPDGYFYIIESYGSYLYGKNENIYRMGIGRDSDTLVIWGQGFAPGAAYGDAQDMVNTEGANVYNVWSPYYVADQQVPEAQALIGF